MITPRQITDPHAGHAPHRERRAQRTSPANAGLQDTGDGVPPSGRKSARRTRPVTGLDPLFDALRAELGL